MYGCMFVRKLEKLKKVVPFLPSWGSGDAMQLIRLGARHPQPLRYLPGLLFGTSSQP